MVRRFGAAQLVKCIKRSRSIKIQPTVFVLKRKHHSCYVYRNTQNSCSISLCKNQPYKYLSLTQRRSHSNSTNSDNTNHDYWTNAYLLGVAGIFSIYFMVVFGYQYNDRKSRLRQLCSEKTKRELGTIVNQVVFGKNNYNYCYDIKRQLIELGLNMNDYNELYFDLNDITLNKKHNSRGMFKFNCNVLNKNENNLVFQKPIQHYLRMDIKNDKQGY